MYTIEEFDKQKSKVLKYILYKKRTKQEVKNKFYNTIDNELLNDIIEELEENGYINDNNYIERAVNEFIALNNLSIKEIRYKLMAKGVSSSLVEDYINNNQEKLEEYETNSARNIILKKQNQMDEEMIIQFLVKKGYKIVTGYGKNLGADISDGVYDGLTKSNKKVKDFNNVLDIFTQNVSVNQRNGIFMYRLVGIIVIR